MATERKFPHPYFYNTATNTVHHAGLRGDRCRERALLSKNIEHWPSLKSLVETRQGNPKVQDSTVKLCGHEKWSYQEQGFGRA